jgi:uncharacterized protein YukE
MNPDILLYLIYASFAMILILIIAVVYVFYSNSKVNDELETMNENVVILKDYMMKKEIENDSKIFEYRNTINSLIQKVEEKGKDTISDLEQKVNKSIADKIFKVDNNLKKNTDSLGSFESNIKTFSDQFEGMLSNSSDFTDGLSRLDAEMNEINTLVNTYDTRIGSNLKATSLNFSKGNENRILINSNTLAINNNHKFTNDITYENRQLINSNVNLISDIQKTLLELEALQEIKEES